jgi:hypothetical protein
MRTRKEETKRSSVVGNTNHTRQGASKLILQAFIGLVFVKMISFGGMAEAFVTLSENNRYFQYENGAPFIPIGHNDGYREELFLDPERLDRYLSHMNEHGENVLRLVLDYVGGVCPTSQERREANLIELRVGEFNPILEEAVENLVRAAERHGIYLILALFPNLYERVPYGTGNWHCHPYNKNNDSEKGLVERPQELFVDPAAKQAAKNRISWFVERWGDSPNILAWELCNEMNALGQRTQRDRWIREMGAHARQEEMRLYGRHHLRTVSSNNAGFGNELDGIYSSSELDFASYHTYDSNGKVDINPFERKMWPRTFSRVNPINYIRFINRSAQLVVQKSGARPTLGTEDMGLVRNETARRRGRLIPPPFNQHFQDYTREDRDDLFIGAAWASILGGGAGPSLRWPCNPGYGENDAEGYLAISHGMYDAQKALREILSSLDWTDFSPTSANDAVSAEDREDIISMALSDGTDMIALFVHHDEKEFSRTEVSPTVTFGSLQDAPYQVTWYDLRTGDALQHDWVQGPEFSVQAPEFDTFVVAVVATP